jgi:hypothetical protein
MKYEKIDNNLYFRKNNLDKNIRKTDCQLCCFSLLEDCLRIGSYCPPGVYYEKIYIKDMIDYYEENKK